MPPSTKQDLFILFCLFLICIPVMAQTREQNPAHYRVSWRVDDFPRAHVTATLPWDGGPIGMTELWNTFFESPRGWAQFVSIEKITAPDGTSLSFSPGEGAGWRVDGAKTAELTVDYSVDYDFARKRWPAGNEQIALLIDESLYSTGMPLFLLSGSTDSALVSFDIPEGWAISLPWPQLPDKKGTYVVRDVDTLLRNCLVVGRHDPIMVEAAGFKLTVAVLGPILASRELLLEAFLKHLNYCVDLFQHKGGGEYLIAILPGPEDGESYMNSFASSTEVIPTCENAILWGNNLAHEFLHYWNGTLISTDRDNWAPRQWFSEGFTEYFANLSLLYNGLITPDQYLSKFNSHLDFYLLSRSNPNFKDVSLRDAGSRKWPNRPTVYSGGVAVAFCLDVHIRRATGGQKSLVDFMRLMYERYGLTGKHYLPDDLPAVVSEVAGEDMSDFFAEYINGTGRLPLDEYLRAAGMIGLFDGYDIFMYPDPAANDAARKIRHDLLRK